MPKNAYFYLSPFLPDSNILESYFYQPIFKAMTEKTFSAFESELQVRPDDIDMNNHVHNSRYFDYVLAARYDQMERCYGMSMEEFLKHHYGWVINTAFVEYKRPLLLGDRFIVKTWIIE